MKWRWEIKLDKHSDVNWTHWCSPTPDWRCQMVVSFGTGRVFSFSVNGNSNAIAMSDFSRSENWTPLQRNREQDRYRHLDRLPSYLLNFYLTRDPAIPIDSDNNLSGYQQNPSGNAWELRQNENERRENSILLQNRRCSHVKANGLEIRLKPIFDRKIVRNRLFGAIFD